jgi:excinuclease UvrABC ATPase subunit
MPVTRSAVARSWTPLTVPRTNPLSRVDRGPACAREQSPGRVDVGLPYITLGQPLSTLSGGKRQRLKLAVEMTGDSSVYVLDEPTTGLHMDDVDPLIGLLHRLVEGGRTVVVVEHDLDVIARADWVVDLGPGAGHDGGRIVFEGTPGELLGAETLTAQHLRAHVRTAAVA